MFKSKHQSVVGSTTLLAFHISSCISLPLHTKLQPHAILLVSGASHPPPKGLCTYCFTWNILQTPSQVFANMSSHSTDPRSNAISSEGVTLIAHGGAIPPPLFSVTILFIAFTTICNYEFISCLMIFPAVCGLHNGKAYTCLIYHFITKD